MAVQLTTRSAAGTLPSGETGVTLTQVERQVYGKEILYQAICNMRFDQFAIEKRQLTVEPGQSIQFLKYNDLQTGGWLTEAQNINPEAITASTLNVEVQECGGSVYLSEMRVRTAFVDLMRDGAKLLSRRVARFLNTAARTCLSGATNVVYAAGATGRAGLTATSYFDTVLVKDAVEVLATNDAPKIAGDYYVCFIHPKMARRLRDDPNWVAASHYGAPDQIFYGECGRYEDVRFIETTCITIHRYSGYNVYVSIMIGDMAFAKAICLDIEMRLGRITRLGTRREVGWYGILGYGILEDDNIVLLESGGPQ